MNRKIKFRVWDSHHKTMDLVESLKFSENGSIFEINTDNYINIPNEDLTLMQFTGLLDKNGKEIWEGDIVHPHHHKSRLRQVTWDETFAMFRLDTLTLSTHHCQDMEVLGNIHEHPELIKG